MEKKDVIDFIDEFYKEYEDLFKNMKMPVFESVYQEQDKNIKRARLVNKAINALLKSFKNEKFRNYRREIVKMFDLLTDIARLIRHGFSFSNKVSSLHIISSLVDEKDLDLKEFFETMNL